MDFPKTSWLGNVGRNPLARISDFHLLFQQNKEKKSNLFFSGAKRYVS